jgi:hypothetical protein
MMDTSPRRTAGEAVGWQGGEEGYYTLNEGGCRNRPANPGWVPMREVFHLPDTALT